MRITKYRTENDADNKNVLIKENATNYNLANLNTSESISKLMKDVFHLDRLAEEYVYLIASNTKGKPIGFFELSHGTVNMSCVSPREIFVRLCLCGATHFFLCHNHPSGDVTPSKEDVELTERIKQCGNLMNIPLLDHIIIGNDFYSFSEHNLI